LTIATENIELDEHYCSTHSELQPGGYVRLSVSDDGKGMPPDLVCHVFEPFFTTKPQGSGTGLGLSVTFGAVKQAGGSIDVYSELGLGTTFKIHLPRVDAPPDDLKEAAKRRNLLRGSETILLVEDDLRVRELTEQVLQLLGYKVIVSEGGEAALALVQAARPHIDLLLTDLIMPEMSGPELSRRMRALYPDIEVLYCSGYTEDAFVRQGVESADLQFIPKPFTIQQLALKLRLLLDK